MARTWDHRKVAQRSVLAKSVAVAVAVSVSGSVSVKQLARITIKLGVFNSWPQEQDLWAIEPLKYIYLFKAVTALTEVLKKS